MKDLGEDYMILGIKIQKKLKMVFHRVKLIIFDIVLTRTICYSSIHLKKNGGTNILKILIMTIGMLFCTSKISKSYLRRILLCKLRDVFTLRSGAMSWKSTKQECIARSRSRKVKRLNR
ncbi:hypothetical protein CR513_29387, partial [Mucuna pruriens]